ncbi:MAG: phosphotransferase [Rhodospirillaceae bacterium]
MTPRIELMDRFQAFAGWGDAQRSLLAGDASFRKYYRLVRGAERAVLMDAPAPQEDVRPFVRIANHLEAIGLSAPRILAEDAAAGFLLLDDLGDNTYTRLLAAGEPEEGLYALAIDVLAELHRHEPPLDVPLYDDDRLLTEAGLLPDWFLPAVGAGVDAPARAAWDAAWRGLFPIARVVPEVLVLRDYHVDNLMIVPGRDGLAACGLLDFQDAVRGPLTYDAMSLMEDARRDIGPALVAAMKDRAFAATVDVSREDFDASWAVMAAQRHAKVIGIFTRLWKRDGKPIYLQHIPRVWRLLEAACAHPAVAPVHDWLDTHVPPDVRRKDPR